MNLFEKSSKTLGQLLWNDVETALTQYKIVESLMLKSKWPVAPRTISETRRWETWNRRKHQMKTKWTKRHYWIINILKKKATDFRSWRNGEWIKIYFENDSTSLFINGWSRRQPLEMGGVADDTDNCISIEFSPNWEYHRHDRSQLINFTSAGRRMTFAFWAGDFSWNSHLQTISCLFYFVSSYTQLFNNNQLGKNHWLDWPSIWWSVQLNSVNRIINSISRLVLDLMINLTWFS